MTDQPLETARPLRPGANPNLRRENPEARPRYQSPEPFWDQVGRAFVRNAEDGFRTRTPGMRGAEWRDRLWERHRQIERLTGQRLPVTWEMMGLDEARAAAPADPFDRGTRNPTGVGWIDPEDYEARLEALRGQFPQLEGLESRDAMFARHDADLRGVRARAIESAEAGGLATGVAAFGGQVAAALTDPANVAAGVATGGWGYGRGIATRLLAQGAAGAGIEAAQAPLRMEDARTFGPEYDLGEAALDVAFGFAGGVAIEGLLTTGRAGVRAVRQMTGRDADPLARGALNELDRVSEIEAATPPGVGYDDAANHLRRGDLPPDMGPESELDQLFAPSTPRDRAPQVAHSGTLLQPGSDAAGASGAAAFARAEYRGREVWSGRFDPREVATDALRFQYKADGDASGVTARLRGVGAWDATASGKVIVFEDFDGGRFIADGHQRRGLALRLVQEGFEDGAILDGYMFRARDGWTAREVRVVAALKNIREGSGTILDAAKVFREVPAALGDRSLPVTGDFIQQARHLAALGDDAFRGVTNGVITPKQGAIIGELAVNRPDLHTDLVALVQKAEPRGDAATRALVHEALLDDFIALEGVQVDMFGGLPREATVIARARIREAVMRDLQKDARLNETLVRNADAIEAGGNVLARTDNEVRAMMDRAGHELVSKLSLRSGPLGERFSKGAVAVTEGSASVAGVAREIVKDIRALVKSGEALEVARKDVIDPEPPSQAMRDAATRFDEPDGPGAREQLEPKPEDAALEADPPPGLFDDLMEPEIEADTARVLRACAV
ncbi:MAG: hypothetical protein ACK4E3_10470 [Brevundimonas sp.]|uniref:hypothetical protein n=1 Tax=Brevundimonas sp. TaxID=1871086 RepID=UPI00391C29A3